MSDCHSGSVSMASTSVLFIFAVVTLCVGYAESFVKINCVSKIDGQYGQASVLECKISTKDEMKNPKIIWLSWTKDGNEESLLHYDNKVVNQAGYWFAQQSWQESLDVSLRIANTTLRDEGEYQCKVVVNDTPASAETKLSVSARYSVPTITSKPERPTPLTGGDLECRTGGGYPKGQIRWFDGDGQERTESAKMGEKTTDEGLFQLSSRLNLQGGLTFSNTTCVVFNANGEREQEKTFQFDLEGKTDKLEKQPVQIKVVAPLVVIGSCVVGLLVLLVCRRRRRQYHHPKDQTYEAEPPEGKACVEDQTDADVCKRNHVGHE